MAGNDTRMNRAMQIPRAGAPFEMITRALPEPAPGQVRVRVEACGICHSDSLTKEGHMPGIRYPIVPGHEIVGVVDLAGAGVTRWKAGQRVGIGWHGGHCHNCERCRRGDFLLCAEARVPGIHYDGGYQDYMVAPAEVLASVPDSLASAEAAPLLCAGITTYNALRNTAARAGDLVAILGIGGLGHLGVQFAAKMGFRTVAIARGEDKAAAARELGAQHYIDSTANDVGKALQELGGAKVILATVTNAQAMNAAIPGLGYDGTFLVVGVSTDPIQVHPMQLLTHRQSIKGWPSGTAADSEDTLRFSAMSGVKPLIERYPLERAAEAYERMMSGKARFRVVIEPGTA